MRRAEFNKAVVALAASLFFDPERLTESQKVDAALLRDHESLTRDSCVASITLDHRQFSDRPGRI
jgi:hypothetical protein